MPFDSKSWNLPKSEGLYEPTLEKDACGVGFIVNIEGKSSHQVNEIIWFFSVLNSQCGNYRNFAKILREIKVGESSVQNMPF